MKLYIYNQNCVSAGLSVSQRQLEQHENPDDAGDWTVYEGTEDELIELVPAMPRAPGRPSGYDRRYQRHVAARSWNHCCGTSGESTASSTTTGLTF